MSGDYPPIVGEEGDGYSQFEELMSDYDYWPSEISFSDDPLFDPSIDPPADTSIAFPTPISNEPDICAPPDDFGLFVEGDLVDDLVPFYLFNPPPTDTVSPTDLTPISTSPSSLGTIAGLSLNTPKSPDTIALSPSTPRSPGTDGSRASTAPTTPDSPSPENYEPVQLSAGRWKCVFPQCPRDYRRRCDVNKHCKTHTKPFACSSCGQKSSSKRDKERHELSHESSHPICPYPLCTSTTSRKDNMRDHIKRKHRDMDPKDPIIDELYSKRPRIK